MESRKVSGGKRGPVCKTRPISFLIPYFRKRSVDQADRALTVGPVVVAPVVPTVAVPIVLVEVVAEYEVAIEVIIYAVENGLEDHEYRPPECLAYRLLAAD